MKPDVVRRLSASALGIVTGTSRTSRPRSARSARWAADVDTTPRPLTAEETHVNILQAMQAMACSRTAK